MTPDEELALLHWAFGEVLANAVEGLELTVEEQRTLTWLRRWEPETVSNVASIIRKARAQHDAHAT